MPSLLSQDHYTYLNEFLNLKDKDRLSAEKKLRNDEKLALIARIEAELLRLKAAIPPNEERFKKTTLALDIIKNDDKRALYNQALLSKKKTLLQLEVPGGALPPNTLIPLVPMDQIIAFFETMKHDPKYKDMINGFNFTVQEGDPTIYIFSFPNEEARQAFVSHLFDNNMAMLPNASQDMHDLPQPTSAKPQKDAPEVSASHEKTHSMRQHVHHTRTSSPAEPEVDEKHHEAPKGHKHR